MLKFLKKIKENAHKIKGNTQISKEILKGLSRSTDEIKELAELCDSLVQKRQEDLKRIKKLEKKVEKLEEFKENSKRVIEKKVVDDRTKKYSKWLYGQVGKTESKENKGSN